MYKDIYKFFKFTKITHSIKNILIIFPAAASGIPLKNIDINIFIKGFIALFLLTSACYILNDLKDRNIDKLNKLKKKKIFFDKNKSYLILFVYFTILLLFIILNSQIEYKFLFLYFINFLIYNYFGKNIKFLDIFLLTNFYNIRIFFGADLFNIDPTNGFILLNFTLFFLLSVSKRIIQINVNKLKINNSIISYSNLDIKTLMLFLKFSFFALNFILIFYYLKYFNILDFFSTLDFIFLGTDLELYKILVSHMIFLIYFYYLYKMLNNKRIKLDIYDFIIKNKLTYISLVLIFLMFYY